MWYIETKYVLIVVVDLYIHCHGFLSWFSVLQLKNCQHTFVKLALGVLNFLYISTNTLTDILLEGFQIPCHQLFLHTNVIGLVVLWQVNYAEAPSDYVCKCRHVWLVVDLKTHFFCRTELWLWKLTNIYIYACMYTELLLCFCLAFFVESFPFCNFKKHQ